jgi:probable HAF family extracellular repeat protein
MKQSKIAFLTFFVFLAACQITKAVSYTYTTLNIPNYYGPPNAYGINNADQVTGFLLDNTGTHGFLYSGGLYITFDGPNTPGNVNTRPTAINNLGQIVGFTVNNSNDSPTGFLYSNGVSTPISFPGTNYNVLLGIDDAGEIIGYYSDSGQTYSYIRGADGVYTKFVGPNGIDFHLMAINDAGQLLGSFTDSTGLHYALDSNGVLTVLPDIAGVAPFALNDNGQILYSLFNIENGGGAGILNPDGSYTLLASSDDRNYLFTGINDLGEVTGFRNSPQGAFIGTPTPVPEPQSFVLITLGLAVVPLAKVFRAQRAAPALSSQLRIWLRGTAPGCCKTG